MTFGRHLEIQLLRNLEEDLVGGDLTTEATVPEDALGRATAVAKSALTLSGGEVFARCFHLVSAACRVEQLVGDGSAVTAGAPLLIVEGPTRALLMAERTALNYLQRLSGTASLTRAYVAAAGGRVRITDTRKTTPGLRQLERQAVRDGGGYNHRNDLGSAVLIKENHLRAAGGIRPAIERARAYAPHTSKIEVEVTSLGELDDALAAGADIVLLDNFADDALKEACEVGRGRAVLEASGNMTIERVQRIAGFGLDVISVGALTHSAPAADISLLLGELAPGAG